MGFIENWFHYFNLIGPYLWGLWVLFGVALLIPPFPKTFKAFKYSLKVQITRMLSIPIGIAIAKIVWLSMISSNDDMWSLPKIGFFTFSVIIGYALYRTIEYFTWRKFHAFDGIIASLEGLYKSEHIEEKEKRKIAEPLWKELKEFHSIY